MMIRIAIVILAITDTATIVGAAKGIIDQATALVAAIASLVIALGALAGFARRAWRGEASLADAKAAVVDAQAAVDGVQKALAAVVKGAEVATTALDAVQPGLGKKTREGIKAVVVVEGALETVQKVVEEVVHASKPHTQVERPAVDEDGNRP